MRKIPRRGKEAQPQGGHDTKGIPDIPLPQGYDDKMALLRPYVDKNHDLIARPFYLDSEMKLQACAFYFNAVVDDDKLNEHVFKPLMIHSGGWESGEFSNTDRVDLIVRTSISVGQLRKTDSFAVMTHSIFDGMLVLIFESIQEAVIIDIHGGELRSIEEPPSERATRGPREGFIENLDTNIAMVRRHLRTPRLVIKKTIVGRRTRTPVAVLYIDDIVDHGLQRSSPYLCVNSPRQECELKNLKNRHQ
jgi:spore germination protein